MSADSYAEKVIVKRLVEAAVAAGYSVTIDNGDREVIVKSRDAEAIVAATRRTDEDMLYLADGPGQLPSRNYFGWVRLIYGNGADVISDYTTNLEALLKPINEWVNQEMGT